jgi:AcrR family transcriptional regulator
LARKQDAGIHDAGTREKILEAAERLIAIHGMEGLQLKDVADAVGIRPPSLYAHFESRDDIAREVANRLYRGIANDVKLDPSGDPMEVLLGMLWNMVHYLANHPAQLRLILRDLAQNAFPKLEPENLPQQIWREISDGINAFLRSGIEAGHFRPMRPEAVHAQLVGATAANLCWLGWDEGGNPIADIPIDEIARETQDLARRLLRVSDE